MAPHKLILNPPQAHWDHLLGLARHVIAGGYTRDAIFGGLRIRLFTNQLPLAEIWSDLFPGPQEWHKTVGQDPPAERALSLFAAALPDHEPLIAINISQSAGLVLNQTESSGLLDAVTALSAHKLGEQLGWVARGVCVSADHRAVLVTGPGHGPIAAEIAVQAAGRIIIADPVLVRIALPRRADDARLAPIRIVTEHGHEIVGAGVLQWLRHDAYQEPGADVFCLSLEGRDELARPGDLDLDRCAELYAYPLTRAASRPASPPMVTDAIALVGDSRIAVFSLDSKTFVARLIESQPWIPEQVVREVAQAIECHAAGLTWPPDERMEAFIAEIAHRLKQMKP